MEAWLLYGATLLWTVAYDTFYAMVDRPDDLKIGVKSTAILFGRFDLLMIALLELGSLGFLVILGDRIGAGPIFYVALAMAAALWAWQLWQTRTREPEACFQAFLQNHWVGAFILVGLAGHYVWQA
jgi:4-hydroxybenzoate polyprenyltransferase